jgi:O-antigen/teichoic acid export membrane protein
MAAEIMMGISFNLSFWYKVIDKTIWGAIFSGIGCAVLLLVNIIFVPRYGYMACAWGGFAGYGVAMLASYFVGQKYYPLNYPMKDIALYVVLAIVLFFSMRGASHELPVVLSLGLNTLLILLFAAIVVHRDLPLSKLPVIGKYFRQ